ncbi:MAG: ABC transporter permease [Pyrinomonadaceae bacterium]
MLKLLLRKAIQGVAMLLAVSAVSFALLSAAGGDAFSGLRDNPQVSDKTIEHLRSVYGLDRPLPVRYGKWLAGAIVGDLGESIFFRVSVSALVWTRFLSTLILAVIALFFAISISLSLSILSARYRNRTLDAFIEVLILLTSSTPRIVLALLALALTVRFSSLAANSQWGSFSSVLLASFVLAVPMISLFLAQAHEGLSKAMNEDFVLYARAKGLSEWAVIGRHALRAALNPFLTLFGLSLGALLGGSVIVETVLGWPGIGALIVTAVRNRDVPVVMGVVLAASLAVWFGNTIAELLQMLNDKRIGQTENNNRDDGR